MDVVVLLLLCFCEPPGKKLAKEVVELWLLLLWLSLKMKWLQLMMLMMNDGKYLKAKYKYLLLYSSHNQELRDDRTVRSYPFHRPMYQCSHCRCRSRPADVFIQVILQLLADILQLLAEIILQLLADIILELIADVILHFFANHCWERNCNPARTSDQKRNQGRALR